MTKHNTMPVSSAQILKGIPVPEGARRLKYPFATMEIDDATFGTSNMSGSASTYGAANGKRFTVRPYVLDGVEGYMCWRIA